MTSYTGPAFLAAYRSGKVKTYGDKMNSITIVVSLPHKYLQPNCQGRSLAFARGKTRVKKIAKREAYIMALQASNSSRPRWKRASVAAVFYLPSRRGILADQDNRIASCKAQIDGIAEAGIVENDRGLVWEPVRHEVDAESPRLQLTITELEGN